MMITKQAARLAAATAAAAGLLSGIAACSAPASTPHGAGVGSGDVTNAGAVTNGGPASCATNAVAGYIGTERAGQAAAVRQALGPALLSHVSDSGLGTVDIARNAHGLSSGALEALFSKWYPVYNQSSQSDLKSCHYLLDDKPAAQPLIASAENALAKAGLVSSAADLKSQLQVVMASDNPLSPGSVIMTLMVPGPVNPTPPAPGPQVHTTKSYTVIEDQATAQATGSASGGF